MGYVLVTPPDGEPVSIVEAKAHCRVDHADDDEVIDQLIVAARIYAERTTRRSFLTQTWRLDLDGFPGLTGCIRLTHGPVQALSRIVLGVDQLGIAYRDENDDAQTLDPDLYIADLSGDIAELVPAVDEEWPSFQQQPRAVQVTFDAGYGAAAAVPQSIKHSILMMVGHWYENRETVSASQIPMSEVPMAAEMLLDNFRIPVLA